MFLRGIGIYGIDETGSCRQIISSEDAAGAALFQFFSGKKPDYLQEFEDTLLFKRQHKFNDSEPYPLQTRKYFFIAKKIALNKEDVSVGSSPSSTFLICVASKHKLYEDDEFEQLMKNIQYVLFRLVTQKKDAPACKVTLTDIVARPGELAKKDLFAIHAKEEVANDPRFLAIRKELAQVKCVLFASKEALLERGESVKDLVEKTDTLMITAEDFNKSSKGLEDQLSCCGGVRHKIFG